MGKISVIIALLSSTLTVFSQSEYSVRSTILIDENLEALLRITFERTEINEEKFIMSCINLGNYVRHKSPSHDEKNILSGAWYSDKDKDDLLFGCYMNKGEYQKIIEIKIPNPTEAFGEEQDSFKKIVVNKSSNDIQQYLKNQGLIFVPLETVKILFKDEKLIIDPQNEFIETRKNEFSINLKNSDRGTIKFKRAGFFQVQDAITYLLALAFSYLIFAGLISNNISISNARIFYLICFILTLIFSIISFDKIDETIFHILLSVCVSTVLIVFTSFLPEKIFLLPNKIYKDQK